MINNDKILISDDALKRMNSFVGGTGTAPEQGAEQAPAIDESLLARMNKAASFSSVITPESRMAMFPDEYVDGKTDRKSAFERGYRSFAAGFMSSVPGAMTQLGGIMDYVGMNDAGQALTETGMDWGEWINEHVAVEDPTLANQIASGFGSLIFFMLPGLGSAGTASKIAKGIGLAGKTAKVGGFGGKALKLVGLAEKAKSGELVVDAGRIFQTVFQAGTMATLEAAVEQSQRMEELIGQGQTPGEALKNSEKVFWQNMLMLTATNAPFFSPVGRLARAAMSAGSEGAQERFQSVIQDVASGTGEWKDFLNPDKYRTETIVGFITGGTVGGILPGEGGESETKDDTINEAGEFEGDEPAGFKNDQEKMEELEAEGATDEELEQFAGLLKLERGLAMDLGIDDVDLASRLSPEDVASLAEEATAAQNENDINKAAAMEAAVVERAKDLLFRDGTAAARHKAKPTQEDSDALEAEIDAEVDALLGQRQEERDDEATASVAQAEAHMGKPNLSKFFKQQPTKEEQEVFDARDAKKKEYREDKERRARQKDPTATEKQVLDDMPEGLLSGLGQRSQKQAQEPAAEQAPTATREELDSDLETLDTAIRELRRKKKKTTREKKLLKKLRQRRSEIDTKIDEIEIREYEPSEAGIVGDGASGGRAVSRVEPEVEPESTQAETFTEMFPSEQRTLKTIHEAKKRKEAEDERADREDDDRALRREGGDGQDADTGATGAGRPDVIRANRGREEAVEQVDEDSKATVKKKAHDDLLEKIHGMSDEDIASESEMESFKVISAIEKFEADHGASDILSLKLRKTYEEILDGTFAKKPKKQAGPIEKIKKAAKKKAAKKSPRKAIKNIGGSVSGSNPGGQWLNHEQARASKAGILGAETQNIKGVNLPVEELVQIPGYNNEQDHIKQDNVDELAQSMKDAGGYSGPAIVVVVDQNGVAKVSEGNHRIRAAQQAGIKSIPVEVHYHSGGERVDGKLPPSRVAEIATNLARVSESVPKETQSKAAPLEEPDKPSVLDDYIKMKRKEKAKEEKKQKLNDKFNTKKTDRLGNFEGWVGEIDGEEIVIYRDDEYIPGWYRATDKTAERPFHLGDTKAEAIERLKEQKRGAPLPFKKAKKKAPKPDTKAEPKAEVESSGNYSVMPIEDIHTDPVSLQTRQDTDESGINEDRVQKIIDTFDPQRPDAIIVWKDPANGRMKVLNGHHTLEALRRMGKKHVDVKIWKGTRKEAIQASKDWNDQTDQNDPVSRAQNLRELRDSGASKAEVARKSKLYGADASTILALSHLNPNGKTVKALKALANAPDEQGTIRQYVRWIGEARAKFPSLTNQHENEMFDFLDKNPGMTKAEFGVAVEKRGTFGDFSGMESLNLGGIVKKTDDKQAFDKRHNALTKEKSKLKAQRKAELKEHNDVLKKNELIAFQRELTAEEQAQNEEAKKQKKAIKRKYDRTETLNGKKFKAGSLAEIEHEITQLEKDWNESLKGGTDQNTMFMGDQARTPRGEARYSVHTQNESNKSLLASASKAARDRGRDIGTFVEVTMTDKASDVLRKIGKRFGVKVVFFKGTGPQAKTIGGFYAFGDNRVFINTESKFPGVYILGHEIGHYLESKHKDAWNTISDAAAASVKTTGRKGYASSRGIKQDPLASFSGSDPANRELISDLVAEQFTKEEFWNHLKAMDRALWADLLGLVKHFLKNARAAIKKSGYGLGVYFKNYASLELVVRDQLAKVSAAERKNMAAKEDPFQTDLFKDSGPSQGTLFLDVRDPAMKKAIDKQDETRKGVLSRIRTKIGDIPRLMYQRMVDSDTFLYAAEKRVLKMVGVDIADYDPTKRPYHALRLMAGWTQNAHQSLTDVVMSWDGKKELGLGLQRIIKKFNLGAAIDNGEFGQFAQFSRMKAVFDVRGMNYFTGDPDHYGIDDVSVLNKEQREAMADYEANMEILKRYRGLEPTWDAAVKAISKWNANTLLRAKEAGLFSEKEYKKLVETYELYMPLNVLEREEGTNSGMHALGQYKAGVVLMDPIDAMIKKAYRLEFLMTINNVKITAAEFVEDLTKGRSSLKDFGRRVFPKTKPLQDYIEVISGQQDIDFETASKEVQEAITTEAEMYASEEFEKEGVVSFRRNGETEYWQFAPEILDVLSSQGGKANHIFFKFFSAQTRMLRAGAILTPEFMATNQFRDFMGAMVLSKHLVKNPADVAMAPVRILQGLAAAIQHTRGKEVQIVRDFINAGGGGSTLVGIDMESLRKARGDLTGNKSLLHFSPITALQALTNIFEHSTRLAVFKAARDHLVSSGMSFDKATKIAALEARESSTDFARAGEYGAVLNRIIPFFNAGIQGNDKLFRSVFIDKGNRAATITKGMMLVTAPTIAMWGLNHDEEWYKDLPLFVKNHFWVFSVDGGKTIHKVVKPFEIGMIFGSLVERFLDYMYDEDPKAVESWVKDFSNDILTVDGLSLLGPTLATMSEMQSNYDVYRRTSIVKGYMEDIAPREQYNSSTSELAKVIGGAFPGKGKSPMMIDHLVRGTFGGLGTHAVDIASNIIMFADPERRAKKRSSRKIYDLLPDWTPIIRRVVATNPSRYDRNSKEFFEEYESARETFNTFKSFESGGASQEQFEKMLLIDGAGLEKYNVLQGIAKMAGNISQKIAAVERADPSAFNRGEKSKIIDEALESRKLVFKRGMGEYRKVDWVKVQKTIDKKVHELRKTRKESR